MRMYVARQNWQSNDIRYQTLFTISIPNPHTSGYWEHGFTFDNDYFLLLAVL
jgi:hypothetical protein